MRGQSHLIRKVSKIHGAIYRISRGRVLRRLGNVEFLVLTTIGRRSGKKRNVPLAAIPHRGSYLIVASFGGSSSHPDWLQNIRHNPTVSIRVGPIVKQAHAWIIDTSDTLYGELWSKAVATYQGFDSYRKATSRKIPIVVISFCSGQLGESAITKRDVSVQAPSLLQRDLSQVIRVPSPANSSLGWKRGPAQVGNFLSCQ